MIQSARISGEFDYVVREGGELVIGKSGHPSLAGMGSPVEAAGEVKFVNGVLSWINNESGHYRPMGEAQVAEEAFVRAGFDAFGKFIETLK